MLLWLTFAVLTAVALAAVLRPLLSAEPTGAESQPGVSVYKDQLAEIEADLQRGLIDHREAEAARIEVSRRLLAQDADGPAKADGTWAGRAAIAVALMAPVTAVAAYLALGSPGVPGQPFAQTRAGLVEASVSELVRRVEQRLADHPNDGQGWDVIAPVYTRMQRFDEAAAAYARAAALLGENPQRLSGFAEATVMANNGIVTEPARLAYEKLAKLVPDRIEPRFWLALAKEQDGRLKEAASDYRALLEGATGDAPWRAMVVERLVAVDPTAAPPAPVQRGPSAADAEAAAKMSPEDRARMIEGMVASLAERLKTQPKDVEGWVRLVRAYAVLGDRAKATAALGDARRNLAGDPAALGKLDDVEKALGLRS